MIDGLQSRGDDFFATLPLQRADQLRPAAQTAGNPRLQAGAKLLNRIRKPFFYRR